MGVTGLYLLAMLPLTFNRCGVWKTSLTLWNDVLDQYPKVATALNNRGKYYGKDLGDLVKARTDLDLSIKYDPYYPNAYSNRGIIFCMQGKFDSAIADFNTCIRLPGNHFDAQLNRAIAYAQTHHPDLALEDFNKCVELEPGKTEAVTNRGVLLLYMNQPEKALADFNTAIRLNPDDPDLYVHRSHAFYNLGKYREALQDLHLVMNSGRKVDESFYNQVKNSLNK
jgi:tetratricopeptide (TPR) repeat protein